jgi:hypothetical protein
MIERAADLWTVPADVRVITTNGTVRRDGRAVMGRGCARQAALRFPRLPYLLGDALRTHGNRVHVFDSQALRASEGLVTFPVKHHWAERADLALIAASVAAFAGQLLPGATYVMPRPGCGNGGLRWADVRPLLLGLPDSVIVVHFAHEED